LQPSPFKLFNFWACGLPSPCRPLVVVVVFTTTTTTITTTTTTTCHYTVTINTQKSTRWNCLVIYFLDLHRTTTQVMATVDVISYWQHL